MRRLFLDRLFILFVLLVFVQGTSPAAFNLGTAWDVRDTGDDNNGGGFNVLSTGTDRSQSDAAFQAYTDILIDAATTKGSSAAHAFGATTVGNIINITGTTAGTCTVQRVQAVSNAAGLITFDKALGVAGSTCIGNLGGGLKTVALAASLVVAQNTVHVKNATYTQTATTTLLAVQQQWYGYNATHGDQGTAPLITTATDSTPLFSGNGTGNRAFTNFRFSNTAAVQAAGFSKTAATGGSFFCTSCQFDGFTSAISGPSFKFDSVELSSTIVANSTSHGIDNNQALTLIGSWIHDSGGNAVNTADVSFECINSLISDNAGGVSTSPSTNTITVSNCTFANNNSNGLNLGGSGLTKHTTIHNSIFYNNNGWGVSFLGVYLYTGFVSVSNALGANTRGDYGVIATATAVVPTTELGKVTLAADPFVNSAADDYGLNNTAGGGAACRQAGFPGTLSGGPTGYIDIGAIQAAATAGGGTHGSAFTQ